MLYVNVIFQVSLTLSKIIEYIVSEKKFGKVRHLKLMKVV